MGFDMNNDFANMNAAECASYLTENMANLSAKDSEFAASLVSGFTRYGRASDKQLYWLRELAKRTVKPAQRETVDLGDFAGIAKLFDNVQGKLKRPAIVINDGETDIRLTVAGAQARVPGSINVATKGAYGEATWFGRILSTGKFELSPRVDTPKSVLNALQRFSADPVGVAQEHGRKTGACCFCNRELTDGRSINVGYGPICAENYGLPWGEAKAA